jgi:hypothetical protein
VLLQACLGRTRGGLADAWTVHVGNGRGMLRSTPLWWYYAVTEALILILALGWSFLGVIRELFSHT